MTRQEAEGRRREVERARCQTDGGQECCAAKKKQIGGDVGERESGAWCGKNGALLPNLEWTFRSSSESSRGCGQH